MKNDENKEKQEKDSKDVVNIIRDICDVLEKNLAGTGIELKDLNLIRKTTVLQKDVVVNEYLRIKTQYPDDIIRMKKVLELLKIIKE